MAASRTCDSPGHDPAPSGYTDRAAWMEWMHEQGWVQRKCSQCKRYAFWVHPETGRVFGDGTP